MKAGLPLGPFASGLESPCGSRHQRVMSLNLSNMDLSDRIPPDLGNLSFLFSLDLERNNFHGNLPQEMTHLRRLKFLDLSFNNFSRKVPSWFGFLHQVQVLSLRNNKQGISNLPNMNWLSIQHNQLTGSIPSTLFKIEIIAFTGNSLSGNLPNGLCNGLPILIELYLSGNKVFGHMPTRLSNCSQLQVLSLPKTEFDGPIQSEIGRLRYLQQLYLGSNHFTGIIPKEIGNLANLVELSMEGNQITET
ncbi:hypothetical protein P3S68_003411 [Capsicum galapagoense]